MEQSKVQELRKKILAKKSVKKAGGVKPMPKEFTKTKGKKLEEQIIAKIDKGLKEEIGKLSRRLLHLERRFIEQTQVLSNHRLYKMEQQGNFVPIWDHTNNPQCQWIDKGGKCLNSQCNWYNGQCIFAGWYEDCKFNKSVYNTKEIDLVQKKPKVKKK